VDLGGVRVKLLELEHAGAGLAVRAYASAPIPENAIQNQEIADAEAVAEALLNALERSGTRAREAAIAVADTSVFSKTILMPADLSDADLEQQIHFDAAHHIPHPIAEVNLDFQVLGPDPDNPQFNRVLLVACRSEHVESRTAALEMANLRARIVDVEKHALHNACSLLTAQLPAVKPEARVAVFDVSRENTRLAVLSNGQSLYAREIGFSGDMLIRAVLARHDLASFDMLRVHLQAGGLDPDELQKEVAHFGEQLTPHIDQALNFYQSVAAEGQQTVDHIIVTGVPNLFPGLEEALAGPLAQPVSLGHPLGGMEASATAKRNHVETDAPMLMVAAGLALRGVA
jgi:type IV pilus assembly protein PilM